MSIDAKSDKLMTGPPVLRVGHLLAFTSWLSTAGVSVERLLRVQKLPVMCDEPDFFVPVPNLWGFFEAAARAVDPDVGWLVGKHMGDQNLNHSLLQKLQRAPSLYLALQGLVQSVREEASDLQLGLYERADDVLLFTHYPGLSNVPGYDQSQAYQLGLFIGVVRHFLGKHWVPDEIGVQCQRSPTGLMEIFPHSRIRTGQNIAYVAVPRNGLHRAALPRAVEPLSDGTSGGKNDFEFAGKLRAILRSYLPDGYPSASFAAELMGISERSLARRLSAKDLTYGNVVDDLRFTMAKELLQNSDQQIGEVALSVGFQDQSNFNRMFRRMGGTSPKQFRKAMRH
ncbi:MAG: helix-turn-helix domain-containing protein [Halioglobus sp.]